MFFLKDVNLSNKKKDDDFYDEFITDSINVVEYNELPDVFVNIDSWPKSTNLQCVNCDLSFRGRPWFIPIKQTFKLTNDNVQENALIPYLIFCSPFCVMRYITFTKDPKITNTHDAIEMLKEEALLFLGKKVIHIPPAEPKTIMIQYIGEKGCTPQEYKDKLAQLWDKIIYKN
jgi:hypothetical protein